MSASLNTLAAQFSAASQSLLTSSRGLAPEGDEEGDEGPGNEGGIASPPGLTVSNAIQGGQETLLILTRLEAIEKTQSRLLAKMANFETSTTQDRKAHIEEWADPRPLDSKKGSGIEEVPTVQSEKDKEKLEERKVETMSLSQDLGSLLKNLISRLEGVESRMEGLEGRVDTLSETVRLEYVILSI